MNNAVSLPGEFWRKYDNNYLLSSKGRWYSIRSRKILREQYNSSGYSRVRLYKKLTFTHIKVVQIFGDRKGNKLLGDQLFAQGLSIDHVDGNKHNNTVCNLELVTHKENCSRYRNFTKYKNREKEKEVN